MKKDNSEIKVVIVNPECIPIAQERLVKFLYDAYVKETNLNDMRKLKKKIS